MDKIRAFIDETVEFYHCKNWDEALSHSFELVGFDWIREKAFDWEYLSVHTMELEMRSALEFLRPELNPFQLGILEKWDAFYSSWRDEGIFFERYETAQGARFTWQDERDNAAETLGRIIPKSHWWFWPPNEKPKRWLQA